MKKYVFGVDVGGTTVKMGLFNVDGEVLDKWEIKTRTENGGEAILPDIAASALAKLEEKGIAKEEVAGVGIGIPGPINDEGVVPHTANLGWGYKEVTKELEYILAENGDNKNEPTFTLRKPTEFDDYKEIGWTTNGEAIVNVGDYQSLSDITTDESYELYGVYERDLKIEYDSNGSPNKQETQKQIQNYHSFLGQTEHEFTIADAIKRTGYTYVNWARGSISGTRTAPGTKVKIEEHQKYFAIWDVNEFNIQYDYNDGVISGNSTSKSEYDKEIKLEIEVIGG